MNDIKELLKRPYEKAETSVCNAPQNLMRKHQLYTQMIAKIDQIRKNNMSVFERDPELISLRKEFGKRICYLETMLTETKNNKESVVAKFATTAQPRKRR